MRVTRFISSAEIAGKIRINNLSVLPKMIIAVAPVRSGTTATLRLFAESGIKSYRQPLKSVLRCIANQTELPPDGQPIWMIPGESSIYLKETLGPHSINESLLNPIEVFFNVFRNALCHNLSGRQLTAKVMDCLQAKVHIVIMGRDPLDSLCSNLETYKKLVEGTTHDRHHLSTENELIDNFILAYQQVDIIKQHADNFAIPVSHYVYEANQRCKQSFPELFRRLGLENQPKLSGWTDKSQIGADNSNVIIVSDYNKQAAAGLHENVNQSDGIRYIQRNTTAVSSRIKNIILTSGLYDIFGRWRDATESELGISIPR